MGQVSQIEDIQTRAEDDLGLGDPITPALVPMTPELRAKQMAQAAKAKREKDAAREARAHTENDRLRAEVSRLNSALGKQKASYGKLYYENKILRSELRRASLRSGFKLSLEGSQVLLAAKGARRTLPR